MRVARFIFSLVIAASFLIPSAVIPSAAQTVSTPSSIPAAQYLRRALAALSGTASTSDVTLTGTARRIVGSDDETGTATVKAIVGGASRLDLNLSSGVRSEVQNNSGGSQAGTWSGPDGVAHPMAIHNLLTDPSVFFPAFPITHGLTAGYVANYVGHETREGQAVEHVSISQASTFQTPDAPTVAHLSQMDFFLDSTTFLPTVVTFNIHPDNNALLDIPIEVRFSDYRTVNGVQVPFHVQKFLNNGLILDLQFQTVTFNSGLTANL